MAERCTGTKKDGAQCGAWAVTGQPLCAGHAGLGIAADPATYGAAAAVVSAQARSRRAEERRMSLLDRISAETEARAEEIVRAYFEAGARGDWRALEALVTRVHGRPVERVQVDAPADPLGVASMTSAERAALLAQVLEQHPHLAALTTRTPRVPSAPQSLH